MKRIYHIGKNYVAKPLMGLALLAGLNGCDEINSQNYTPRESVPQVSSFNQFTEHKIGKMSDLGRAWTSEIAMALGDMDNDGDLDMVVINGQGNIFIYEITKPI